MESLIGHTVLHYAFLEKLGAGGMGEIYKARDSRLNRIVAVKVLAPGRTRDPAGRRRFIQEAQAASALNHPNIITIHDILPDGDTQYMVMEYVSGKTLHDLIAGGKLPVSQVLQLALQMANALGVAHAAGIIHRDFKPANVMVTGSGLVKILDFGLAKLTDLSARMSDTSDGEQNTLTAAPLTREGSIMGTVHYMSPEQAEGLKVDGRSDIFSFGAVLYEMLTGCRAFDGDSGISTLSAVLRDEVRPIHEIAPEVPAEVANFVSRCLRKNPTARWQSMTEVEAALGSLKRQSDSGIFHEPPVSDLRVPSPPLSSPPVSGVASAVPNPVAAVPPQSTARKSGVPKALLLGAVCLAVLALSIVSAWWLTYKKPAAAVVAAPAPVRPAAPAPAPAQTPATQAQAPVTPPAESAPATPPQEVATAPTGNGATAPPVAKVTKAAPAASNVTKTAATPPVSTPAAPAAPARAVAVAPVIRSAAPAQLVPVTLNDGVPFRIALTEDVPLDAQVGLALRFRVLDGVQSGETTVIAKGSIVTGALVDLGGKRNFFGERSKVRFRLIAAESVDDAKISIRATPASRTDGVETRPFATPNGTKDKNLIAASGTEYIAYISGEQTVNVHK
jgi:serine/threonine protein kinase